MSIDQLALAAAAAIGDDTVRKLLTASAGLGTGSFRKVEIEIGADRRPIVVATDVFKGAKIPHHPSTES